MLLVYGFSEKLRLAGKYYTKIGGLGYETSFCYSKKYLFKFGFMYGNHIVIAIHGICVGTTLLDICFTKHVLFK